MSESQITKAMVFAYFAHQATAMERQQIEAWVKTKEGLEAYFTFLDEWERQFPQFQANLEEGRGRFTAFMREQVDVGNSENETIPVLEELPGKPRYGWMRRNSRWLIAASFIVMAGLWFSKDLWYYRTRTSPGNQALAIRLEDGSEIELSANSSLRYPRFGFGSSSRDVWLRGDAEFKVVHLSDDNRFKVHLADQTVIEVLGTEFMVNSRSKATRVMLKTGSIRLTSPDSGSPLIMKPGDLVTISSERKIRKEQLGARQAEITPTVRSFEFRDTPLKEVARQLYESYGVSVGIKEESIRNRTVSGSFQAETAEDLLEAIGEMMKLKIEKIPGGYLVRNDEE